MPQHARVNPEERIYRSPDGQHQVPIIFRFEPGGDTFILGKRLAEAIALGSHKVIDLVDHAENRAFGTVRNAAAWTPKQAAGAIRRLLEGGHVKPELRPHAADLVSWIVSQEPTPVVEVIVEPVEVQVEPATATEPASEGGALVVIRESKLNLHGVDNRALLASDGYSWLHIGDACEGLGVAPGGQTEKIQGHPVLAPWSKIFLVHDQTGRVQEQRYLRADKIAYWISLFNPNKVGEATRAKLVFYQNQVADVLAAHFTPNVKRDGGAIWQPASDDDEMDVLLRGIIEERKARKALARQVDGIGAKAQEAEDRSQKAEAKADGAQKIAEEAIGKIQEVAEKQQADSEFYHGARDFESVAEIIKRGLKERKIPAHRKDEFYSQASQIGKGLTAWCTSKERKEPIPIKERHHDNYGSIHTYPRSVGSDWLDRKIDISTHGIKAVSFVDPLRNDPQPRLTMHFPEAG